MKKIFEGPIKFVFFVPFILIFDVAGLYGQDYEWKGYAGSHACLKYSSLDQIMKAV